MKTSKYNDLSRPCKMGCKGFLGNIERGAIDRPPLQAQAAFKAGHYLRSLSQVQQGHAALKITPLA